MYFDGNPVELYDLDKDIGETTNLAAREPDIVKDLQQAFEDWESGMVEPAWPPLRDAIDAKFEGKSVTVCY